MEVAWMSDKIPYAVVIGEGVHDVMTVVKILMLKGFKEINRYDEIPEILRNNMIPRKYPWADSGNRLTWTMPHPSFLVRNGCFVVVSNANGKTELGRNLFGLIGGAREEVIEKLNAIAIVADADCDSIENKRANIHLQLLEAFKEQQDFLMEEYLSGTIKVNGNEVSTSLYVFPDQKGPGTLETILIEGAQKSYPDLLAGATEYVEEAKKRYLKYLKNYDADKAIVGVVANVLRPGRPNQTSIHDNEWLTLESLTTLPLHKQLSDFVEGIIQTLN